MKSQQNSSITLTEKRYLELIEKEKNYDALLAYYPELKLGQKLTPTSKRYKQAFQEFVDKTNQLLQCPELVAVFTVAAMHGCEYKGPSLAQDIAKAKKLLNPNWVSPI